MDTMVAINPLTGLKRRLARRHLPRKKRQSLASTVTSRMCSSQAQDSYKAFMCLSHLNLVTAFMMSNKRCMVYTFLLHSAITFFTKALAMLRLDSALMDIPANHDTKKDSGHNKRLVGIDLSTYSNDDECESFTRFTKREITMMLDAMQLPDDIRVVYDWNAAPRPKCYKFGREGLLIYMLRYLSTATTHKHLADVEFGGDSKRWGTGYNWMINKVDTHFAPIIGPAALQIWATNFPHFAECIRKYLMKDKPRKHGPVSMKDYPIREGEFNVFSITDCTAYEICRPGSGPATDDAPKRKDDWWIKQRTHYDGHHRAFEACLKILTICLPNGLTAAVYGPTAGREEDKTLFRMAEFDDYLADLCVRFHGGRPYCTYGDGTFAGYWCCLRTAHKSIRGMPLTGQQEAENANMTSARESVEFSYARAEELWPYLNKKDSKKLEGNASKVVAEVRVMCLLTNFKVCCAEGSTMTGERVFQCPPPTLRQCLDMMPEQLQIT